MRLRGLAGRLEPWILVGVALWALHFHLTLPGRLATEEDWQALAATLSREVQPGDAVMLPPRRPARARRRLPGPVGRLGDPRAADRDLLASPRIWLVSQPRLPRASTRAFLGIFEADRLP